ncbi:efflux RND transporter periplasmic adaptor subunit [Pseudomonas sp. NPDC089422]|uniref:efflux RND transporter periplasmic adaptor subunit n=1 Tax=Pseudomonas sp. NPDC089422 TaxID=3364466 RepID=UPI003807F5DB
MDHKNRYRAATLVAALAAAGLAGCQQEEAPPEEVQAKTVSVETVTPTRLQLTATLPGRVEPVRVAEIRARVAGIVIKRHFEEGAEVKAGDVLFEIDPAPLRAALAKAQGDLGKAAADVIEAQSKLKRYGPLVKINAVSQEDYDTAKANLQRTQAARQSAQAEVDTARLNLSYASVTAPIAGKIGRSVVTEGALVGQGEATLMAKIQQLDPIYVDFTQTASAAINLRESLKDGRLSSDGDDRLQVRVEDTGLNREGRLLFSDVAVDQGTGQVTLRGRFDNPDRTLLPGMYVRVEAPQGIDANAMLVPQRSIKRDRNGQAQVWLVDAQGTLALRSVQTGTMQGGRWQITQGLHVGDKVVVSNLDGLTAGDKVTLTTSESRSAHLASE